nr:MAG TPA: hypothetical protein [Caudoviricetes sp.]
MLRSIVGICWSKVLPNVVAKDSMTALFAICIFVAIK